MTVRKARLAVCLALVLFVPCAAFAAVPVSRVDNFLEKQELALKVALENWYKNKVLSLANISSIQDLINLPQRLQGLAQNLNIGSILGNMGSQIVDKTFGELTKNLGSSGGIFSGLSQNNIGSGMNLANIVKKKGINEASKILDQNIESLLGKQIAKAVDKVSSGASGFMSDPDLKGYSAAEKKEIVSNMLQNSSAYLDMIKETAPLAIPDVQKGAMLSILKSAPNKVDRDNMMYRYAQDQKNRALESIGSIAAKYEGNEDKTYRSAMNEVVKQTEEIIKQASSAPKGNDSALIATSIFTASTMKILALQNYALANLSDMLADEIRLMSRMAVLNSEGYSKNLYDSFTASGALYDKTAISTKTMTRPKGQ